MLQIQIQALHYEYWIWINLLSQSVSWFILISIIALSFLSYSFFKQQDQLLAQQYLEAIKYRDLVIDLDNGVKTSAQLTLLGIGKGPFLGVLLIPCSGVADKNGTVGFVHKDSSNLTLATSTPLCR